MATVLTHSVVAIALGKIYSAEPMPFRFWAWSIVCSSIPDADLIGIALDIPSESLLGHRGFTHSLCFSVLMGFIAAAATSGVQLSRVWWALVGYFFVVTASHGVIDAMTNGGNGIAFFQPFIDTRYFLPWRPVKVAPISWSLFGFTVVKVLVTEIVCIWCPAICAMLLLDKYRNRPAHCTREV